MIKLRNAGENAFVTSVMLDIGDLSDKYKLPFTYYW